MLFEDVSRFLSAAKGKVVLLSKHPVKYILRAIAAGCFIGMAMIISNVVTLTFRDTFPQWGRILGGCVFSIALLLIVFIGGELFTGNNFVMAFACYGGDVRVRDMLKVWLYSYIGNLIGCVLIASLFVLSGGSGTKPVYAAMAEAKLNLPFWQMFAKAVLCNFFVCLAVAAGIKCKGDAAKIALILFCIGGFVISGLEHCVANMANLTMVLYYVPGVSIWSVCRNMAVVTVGNMLGGGVLLALLLRKMSADD